MCNIHATVYEMVLQNVRSLWWQSCHSSPDFSIIKIHKTKIPPGPQGPRSSSPLDCGPALRANVETWDALDLRDRAAQVQKIQAAREGKHRPTQGLKTWERSSSRLELLVIIVAISIKHCPVGQKPSCSIPRFPRKGRCTGW